MRHYRSLIGKSAVSCALACAALLQHDAEAKEFRILYTFEGNRDGAVPGGLIRDRAHNLFGTAQAGGGGNCEYGCGTIYKLAPDGTQTVLYTFTGGNDGAAPVGALLSDRQGNFYGTAVTGGAHGNGTVFKLAPDGTLTVLHDFAGGNDGVRPASGVISDGKGNLYGTTSWGGGAPACQAGCGTVYRIAPNGTETILHTFAGGNDGAYPFAALVRGRGGELFGTTVEGGKNAVGTVFKITRDGHESVLHVFSGGDGGHPYGGLIEDKTGNLVGTTSSGAKGGCGNVFTLTPTKTFTVLYAFGRYYGGDACAPEAALFEDGRGNFYGTTAEGGANEQGSVFKLTADGIETLLYSFTAEEDGYDPQSTPIADDTGRLYATAFGVYNGGTVFRLPE